MATTKTIVTISAKVNEITFSESDIVDIDSWIPQGEYNPHNVRPWLLHDHGFVVAVVFASNLQDALDIAVDADKMDRYLIDESSNTPGKTGLAASDYPTLGTENEDGISRLGNAGEPFDIESLGYIELNNPARSFVAQYLASFPAAR